MLPVFTTSHPPRAWGGGGMRRKSSCAGWAVRQRRGEWGAWLESVSNFCSLCPMLKWHVYRKSFLGKTLTETEVGRGFPLLSVMHYALFQLFFSKALFCWYHYQSLSSIHVFHPGFLFSLDSPRPLQIPTMLPLYSFVTPSSAGLSDFFPLALRLFK